MKDTNISSIYNYVKGTEKIDRVECVNKAI